MSLNPFGVVKDAQSMMLRVVASLERIDAAAAEAQVLFRNANDLINEGRYVLLAFKAALTTNRPPGA